MEVECRRWIEDGTWRSSELHNGDGSYAYKIHLPREGPFSFFAWRVRKYLLPNTCDLQDGSLYVKSACPGMMVQQEHLNKKYLEIVEMLISCSERVWRWMAYHLANEKCTNFCACCWRPCRCHAVRSKPDVSWFIWTHFKTFHLRPSLPNIRVKLSTKLSRFSSDHSWQRFQLILLVDKWKSWAFMYHSYIFTQNRFGVG